MKILCLGNNDYNTDEYVSQRASKDNTVNNGLITDPTFIPKLDGYYHTTLVDLTPKEITNIAQYFDLITIFEQPTKEWSHWKLFLSTYKLIKELENNHQIKIESEDIFKGVEYFQNLVQTNKSFCIYPFIELTEGREYVTLCARSNTKIANKAVDIINWKSAPEYKEVRENMINGKQLPNHCQECYDYENKGIESSRQFETMDWVGKLELNDINDVLSIDHPYYYEIRLSNKCNIMCRSCRPEHSHLIEKEYKIHNITFPDKQAWGYTNFDHVDISKLNKKSRIYLTGGEPSVMPEFYDFMEQCIEAGNTDFDFTIGTNAVSYTPKFLKLIDHFTNMNFSVSVDGYGKINDYQRWLSDFDTMMANAKLLQSKGHNITFLVVPGMYNVTNLHLLFEYFDREWPTPGLYVQVNHHLWQSAYNHPRPDLVIESMKKCQKTKTYFSDGRSCRSTVDSLLAHYSNNPKCDLKLLKQFFDYNDQLDQARGIQLADYIPELDECRKFLG
jgi:organic radical activating enzyme